jgi:hypothetical protein
MTGQANQNAGGVDQVSSGNTKENESVSYQTYLKSVDQEKNLRKRLQEIQAERDQLAKKFEEVELTEVQKKGNFEEVINKQREAIKSLESNLNSNKETFAETQKKMAIKNEAMKRGCKNPDKFIRLLDQADLQMIQVSDNYEINSDDVKSILDKAVKEDDIGLFAPTKVTVADRTPSNSVNEKEMTMDKLNAAMGKMDRNQFRNFVQNLDKLKIT